MTRLQERELSKSNKALRLLWGAVWLVFFRPSPRLAHGWRRLLLRLFGARLGPGVHVYPSVQVWAPWNLEMHEDSCLSHHVDCYCVDKVVIGRKATVSQYSYLCTASRDYNQPHLPLVSAPIVLEDDAWVTAKVFVGPGVTVHRGGVAAAGAVVIRDVAPWTVVGGNPARPIAERAVPASLREPTTLDTRA